MRDGGIWLSIACLLSVPPLLSRVASGRLAPIFQSPLKIFVLFYAFVGIAGFLFASEGKRIATDLIVPQYALTPALEAIAFASVSVAAGGLAYAFLRSRPRAIGQMHLGAMELKSGKLALVMIAPLLLYLANVQFLIERPTYSTADQTGAAFIGVARILTSFAVIAAGVLYGRAKMGARGILLAIFSLYWLLTLAQASRQLALLPIYFALGIFIAHPSARAKVYMVIASAMAVLLIPIPVYLRGLASHGLVPYVSSLSGLTAPGQYDLLGAVANIVFGFTATSLTVSLMPSMPTEYIAVSVNPLPGQAAGWYDLAGMLRVNDAVPFTMIGELAGAQVIVGLAVWLVAGAILAHIDRRVGELFAVGRRAPALLMLILACSFVVLSTQYNTRNAFRVLVYVLILDVAIRLLRAGPIDRTRRGVPSSALGANRSRNNGPGAEHHSISD